MKANKLLITSIIVAFCVFLAGCNESEADKMNGNWTTQAFEINGELQEIVESNINIEHSSGKNFNVTGCSGINRFSGTVKITDSKLEFDDRMAMTKMAGDPVSMQFEDNFVQCLLHSDIYSVNESNGSKYLIVENSQDHMKLTFKKTN